MTQEEFQIIVLEKFSNLEKRMDSLEKRMDSLEQLTNSISEQTAKLKECTTVLNGKVDTLIENNKSIYEILGEHEVAIRSLKRRPV